MRVRKIERIHLEKPVPVYNLTVDNELHNYTIGCEDSMIVTKNCDELNEKGADAALELMNSISSRFSSRFQGSDFILQNIVSSARTTNSAMSEYIRHLPKNDPSILNLAPCLWEVKPDPNFVGDGTTFPVMVGNGSIPSKIFTDPGELKAIEDGNYEPPTGCEIIHVPTVYRSKFELQLDQSIQDIAGMTTSDNNSVFRDTTRLEEPFLTPEMYFDVSIREDVDILSLLEPYNLFEKTINDRWQFKRAPMASRYCFVDNTKVSTLDGKEKTMKELAEDFDKGVKNWVYSWDNERGWSIGEIVFAGITSYGKKLCRVTLDNGEIIECTPDHKFMSRSGEYIKAKDLTNGTSLMPLYRKMSKIVSFKRKTYEQLKDNRTQDYVFTHKLSADVYCENKIESIQKAKERKSFVVRHHKDFNATNNNPDNLVYMESGDHFALHSKRGTDHFTKLWNTEEFKNKMKRISSKNGKVNGYKDMMNKWYGPENEKWREYLRPIQAKNGRKCFLKYNKTNEHREKAREVLKKQRKDPEFNKKVMIGRIKACIAYLMSRGFSIDEESWVLAKNCPQYIRYDTALKYVDNLESVKDNLIEYNHKVKSIELIELDESIPLYDLTIKDKYNCHNFALSAGVVVSNCHVDLSGGGLEGQCDTGLCVLHKEWRTNPNTKEKEVVYVVDLQLFINAKNKVDIHAIQTFLINLVVEKNIPIHTVSFDQYNSLMIMQQLEASGCFVNVEKVSVDIKLEPYTNAATLMEKGQVKIGRAPKLKKELEALIIDKGKVTRTTELKDACLLGDTKIPLLSGEVKCIKDLLNCYEGQYIIGYDLDKNKLVPVAIKGVVDKGERDDLYCITLDNGKKVVCTGDHLILKRDKTYVRADDLKVGDSLLPITLLDKVFGTKRYKSDYFYKKVVDPDTHKQIWLHRIVAETKIDEKEDAEKRRLVDGSKYLVIHHIDHNKFNNNPDNLQWLTHKEHRKLHGDIFTAYNKSVLKRKKVSEMCKSGKCGFQLLDKINPEEMRKIRIESGRKNITKYNKSKEKWDKLRRHRLEDEEYDKWYKEKVGYNFKNQTKEMIEKRVLSWKANEKNITRSSNQFKMMNSDPDMIKKQMLAKCKKIYQKVLENSDLFVNNDNVTLEMYIDTIRDLKERGIISKSNNASYVYEDLIEAGIPLTNHCVVNIEKLMLKEHVYDIQLDSVHNFMIDSGIFVHNCDALVGAIWDAQINYADFPVYEFEDPSQKSVKVFDTYEDLIDVNTETLVDL